MFECLHTIKTSDVSGTYVLDGCLCNGDTSLCLSLSDFSIRCYDINTARFISCFAEHTCAIKDITSTPSQPNILYSVQEDTGVMITDMRQSSPAHFLTEFCESGATSGTVGVTLNGRFLGVAVDGDTHIVDTRTWKTAHLIANMHLDEITRLRFLDDTVYCSAGEDQMINFIDSSPKVKEDDMLLQAISCGETVTKMTVYQQLGVLGMIGSCENAYFCSLNLEESEVRFQRPNCATYLVDTCVFNEQLHVVQGTRDDDGNADAVLVMNWLTRGVTRLPNVHSDICRIAIGVGGCLITGGEDNLVVFWRAPDVVNDALHQTSPALVTGASGRTHVRPHQTVTRLLQSTPYAKEKNRLNK